MKIYEAKDILLCPHCHRKPDGGDLFAEDFMVPKAKVGAIEYHGCGYCDGEFAVKALPESKFAAYGEL